MKKITSALCLTFAALSPVLAQAEQAVGDTKIPHSTLREIAQKAIVNNPEVQFRWHTLRAAENEVDFARGAFLPRVDFTVGTGAEKLKQPPATTTSDFSRNTMVLSLNQMLFDGFAARSEVRRLGKARMVRYYELLDASENIALEAGRAYLDVLRYRFLNDLAEDNYVQHRATYEQILRKTQSGVGRRVDLEQAASRLALAEINLSTEAANLHDVTARYQRLTNDQPPTVMFAPALLGSAYPKTAKDAVSQLHRTNAALLASHENVESALHEIESKRAAFMPRVDFRARQDNTSNYMGTGDERTNSIAEVVLSYNLFNGGSDQAREKQFVEKRNVAADLREKACRDTRQTLLIAYNDVRRLREQASFLGVQVGLLEKTRDAYRDQFNVGQRTLLDLLDTENELLSARRAAINADIDLSIAYLRTYAGMGTLLDFVGLRKLDVNEPKDDDFSKLDVSQLCPIEGVTVFVADREALNARALSMIEPPAPVVAAAPLPAAAPTGDATFSSLMDTWAAAWMRKDFNAYIGFYAPTFQPDGGLSREDWLQLRRARLQSRDTIKVTVSDFVVKMDGADRAMVEFRQTYESNVFSDNIKKSLEMIRVDGKWLINRESSVPCEGNTIGGCSQKGRMKKVSRAKKGAE